jgi:hypothetical protein
MTSPPRSPAVGHLDRTAQHTWALFADWCDATGHVALPAQPETLAEFLADHPARVTTHRRRVAAINSVHRHSGLPEPGRAHAVHAALVTRRVHRLQVIADALDECIRGLPVSGWPQGLFGRRDALILSLVRAGLTYTEIAALRRGDLRQRGHELVIASRRRWRLGPGDGPTDHSPLAVYARWARVQAVLDGFPSIRMLRSYFDGPAAGEGTPPVRALGTAAVGEPLMVSIDRWGYTPLRPTPLSEQSIAAITRAHLSGQAPAHRGRPARPSVDSDAAQLSVQEPPDEPIVLDHRYYLRGVQARRRAHSWLTTVVDELDAVSGQAEQLLEQLAAIVRAEHHV